MNKLFISYSRRDSEFVDALAGELERRGYDVWIDREDILGGTPWREEIVDNIREANVFIIILSPNSVYSPNVTKELALADTYKVRIVPVLLEPVDIPAAMEYRVSHLQVINFSNVPFGVGLERLLKVLPPAPIPVPVQPPAQPVARKKDRKFLWMGLGGVGGLSLVALVCVGAILLLTWYSNTPTPAPPVVTSSIPITGPTEEIIVQPVATAEQSNPDELFAFATDFLSQAVNAEIQTYRNADISYISAYMTGEPLESISLDLQDLASRGLVKESIFDFNLSHVSAVRAINPDKIEVDTCEYWASNFYNLLDGSLVYSESVLLYPQTIVIERFSPGWLITKISFYNPPSFCD